METIFLLLLFWLIGYGLCRLYMFFYQPEAYAAMRRREHEREMAKEAARVAAKGKLVNGLAGTAAKVLLGAVFNHKRHG